MNDATQAQPQGSPAMEKPCMNCGQVMKFAMPMPTIFNALHVSTIIFVHNRPDVCPSCKSMFLPIIEGFGPEGDLVFKWQPVGMKPKQGPMIIGGGDKELKHAIEVANLAEKIKREGN